MAKFNTVGLEEIERQFLLRGDKAVKAVPLMLAAGATIVIKAQQDTAEKLNISGRSRGALSRSIEADKIKQSGSSQYVDVFPHGIDRAHTRKGVRNAEKGFVLEYGHSNMQAYPWMAPANENSADDVLDAQLKVWEKVTDGSG